MLANLVAGFHTIDTGRHTDIEYHNVKRFAFVTRHCCRLYSIGALITGHDFKFWLVLEFSRSVEEFSGKRTQGAHLSSRFLAAESFAVTFDHPLVIDGQLDEPFYQALNDDLNTPVAIAGIHSLAGQLHKASAGEKPARKARILAAGNLLGILEQDPEAWLQGGVGEDAISGDAIEALIAERHQAKLDKHYGRADEIRQELLAQGVVLEDSREGTQWRRG